MCQTFALNFYICKQTAPHIHYSSPARPWDFGQPGSSSELFHWRAWLQLSYGLAPDMDVWGLPGSPQVFSKCLQLLTLFFSSSFGLFSSLQVRRLTNDPSSTASAPDYPRLWQPQCLRSPHSLSLALRVYTLFPSAFCRRSYRHRRKRRWPQVLLHFLGLRAG